MSQGCEEIEWNGRLVTQLLNRLSLKQCIEYLMNATKLQYSLYPYVLQQVSIKYLGGSNFFIRFKSSSTKQLFDVTFIFVGNTSRHTIGKFNGFVAKDDKNRI